MIKRETYLRKIRPFIGKDLIKVLSGIRRCGKSVMLELIKNELIEMGVSPTQFISFNFENLSFANLYPAGALRDEIIRRAKTIQGKIYLFLDEIQEVEAWEKSINSLRVELDCDIYLTGSNAKLLSGELATCLGGRYVEIIVHPFSFAEFSELYATIDSNRDIAANFRRYLIYGGMPYLANLRFEDTPSRQYLTDLFNSIQLKDVVRRNNIRDVDLLERIIRYVLANVGSTFSATALVKFFKNEGRTPSTETILNYLKFCGDAFFIYQVSCQDLVGEQILSANEKYYVADHGIREAVYGGNIRDIQLTLENIVFMELIRRGYEVRVGKIGNQEIDFVAEKAGQKLYVQVAYLLASEETIRREFEVYREVRDNFPKYVLSLDEFDFSRDGILHRNIRTFLLDESWG